MDEAKRHLVFLKTLTWNHAFIGVAVLVSCSFLVLIVRAMVHRAAESAPSHRRLLILRTAPVARLLIWMAAITIIVPLLVEPNFEDVVALIATVSLALAFALKDYVSCIIAGIVTILENTYQPGDWIEIDGAYGEVKTVGTRAVHIVTADDDEIIIPHAKLWSSSVSNSSSGSQSLLCVANFYLKADHDGAAVREALTETANACGYRKPETQVKVMADETPWGTRYKIKAYVADSREQFAMITDLTIRSKERLRALGVAFAQAPYSDASGHKY